MNGVAYTLVVSDLHLCGHVPDGQAWLGYRARARSFDRLLAGLIGAARRRANGGREPGSLTVVLNGDAFDLDAPDARDWPPSMAELRPRDDRATAALLAAILADHLPVVRALARVLADGHRVVVVAGNHDAMVARPTVYGTLRRALSPDGAGDITLRAAAYLAPGGALIEHGHQYDPACAVRAPLAPEPTLGSVATRCAPAVLGCLNPYGVDPLETDARSLLRSVWQCLRADARQAPRQLAAAVEALRQLANVGRRDTRLDDDPYATGLGPARSELLRGELGCAIGTARAHAELYEAPADLAWLANAGRGAAGAKVVARQREAMARVAALYGASARAVVMGHTHAARGETDPATGVFYGNTGTWSTGGGHYAWLAAERNRLAYAGVHRYPEVSP